MCPFLPALLVVLSSSPVAVGVTSRHPDSQDSPQTCRLVARPVMERDFAMHMRMGGPFGQRMLANVQAWLLPAPGANPAMLQMFRDRDRTPPRDLVPWAGEFAGKYLISAAQAVRLTRDRALKASVKRFVADLIHTQRADGYLGPFPRAEGMTGPGRWDLWGQYHVMLGLYEWYRTTGDRAALQACRRCADHFCATFLDGRRRVVQAGSEEMNESSIHIFTLLYQETGEPRYLQLAREIEKDWEQPPSGDYVRTALAGVPFYKTPKPRWEGLHSVQAIAELYFITGDTKYRRAFEQIWRSTRDGDRHNTGGFSSGEQATGNPYDPRPIETCCTVAWMAISRDMLRMTGDSRAADELEISTWNGIMGAQHPSGRWWTYNTPMDGERKASAHDIVFQARAGSPELNCCSVNGPRGLGMLADWALMRAPNGFALNWYGPGTMRTRLPNSTELTLELKTDYPRDGAVRIDVRPAHAARFALMLRIPGWSEKTGVSVNGKRVPNVRAGAYLNIQREWRPGDHIDLRLDMRPWFWAGENEAKGAASLYIGPLLLACDSRFESRGLDKLPPLDLGAQPRRTAPPTGGPAPIMLVEWPTKEGHSITLCDFASAGATGTKYRTWLPAPDLRPASPNPENSLRLQR